MCRLSYLDYNNPKLEIEYKNGCLKGKTIKDAFIYKIAMNFEEDLSQVKTDVEPYLDLWFKYYFSLQTDLNELEEAARHRFGFIKPAEPLTDILCSMKAKSFRRGIRLMTGYVYDHKMYSLYRFVLSNNINFFYKLYDTPEAKEATENKCLKIVEGLINEGILLEE